MNAATAIERLGTAILAPAYAEMARKSGQTYSLRSGVPGICHISESPVDLFGCTMTQLADSLRSPEANAIIDAECNHCKKPLQCMRAIKGVVACDACIEKHEHDQAMSRAKKYWEHVCPDSFRKTDVNFIGFPKAIYEDLKQEDPKRSMFLYGPTGTGKTRVAMLLLKRALVNGQNIGVLWPEKVRSLTQGYDNSTFDQYAAYSVLLMDDCLLTACRESKLIDAIKMLVDVRQRGELTTYITSQIGTEEELKEAKEFGDAKTSDIERIQALLRRIREKFRIVPFTPAPTPNANEQPF